MALKSDWNPPATMRTAARNLSSAMNICSGVCACATMRISSSTARTLAMPARKIAWLSARINLSISTRAPRLRIAYELVRIDHAGYPTGAVGISTGLVGADNPSATLDDHVFFATGHFRGESDFELDGRTHFQGSISADIHTRGAEVPGHAAGFARSAFLMDLDRQF